MTQVLSNGDDYWAGWFDVDDDINGSGGDDEMHGGEGDDTLNGGADNDTVYGDDGDDELRGGSGFDRLAGGVGFDEMFGGSNDDVLASKFFIGDLKYLVETGLDAGMDEENGGFMDGGSGDDRFEVDLFYTGTMTIDGGEDSDTVDFEQTFVWQDGPPAGTEALRVDLEAGTGETPFGAALAISNVEHIRGTNGEYRDELLGDDNVNNIWGLAGDDLLEGRGGADRLSGGAGFDAVQYRSASAGVHVDLESAGQALQFTAADGTVVSNNDAAGDTLISIEEVRGSRLFGDILRGQDQSSYTEVLFGDGGNDVLEGRGGSDRLDGGAGFDFASYESSTGGVTVYVPRPGLNIAQGADAAGDTLVSIEGLIGSVYGDTLIGNDAVNELRGGGGGDLLSGLGDADTLRGEGGVDELYGGSGTDTLDGGTGNDLLDGGTQSDTADYRSWGAPSGPSYNTFGVNYFIALGQNGADGSARRELPGYVLESDVLRSIENVIGSGYNEVIGGNEQANTLDGGDGDDTLEGRAGTDTLIGGDGSDTASYASSATSVNVSLALTGAQTTGAAGTDTLISIENLTGGSAGDTLTGNGDRNRLNGGAGADTMSGGGGDDTYIVDNASDVTLETSVTGGIDTVLSTVSRTLGANIENLSLTGTAPINATGNTLDNRLIGNAQANTIAGMGGRDVMTGGGGADRFDFDAADHSRTGAGLRDVITDFAVGIDELDFSSIDTNPLVGNDQGFFWRGTDAFNFAGQLRYIHVAGGAGTEDDRTIVQGNLDLNVTTVEFEVELHGLLNLSVGDIVL